jgi:ADP-ribosylglycohydrolase
VRENRIAGALLGAAVGDAIGLPLEGLTPARAARLFPGPPRPRLLLGRAFMSDDGEHACMTAQALLASGGDEDRLARSLAWRLRGWVLAAPAGIGWATLRACVKLWLFLPRRWWGVRSAGNGPAMRAPLLGVVAGDDDARLARWVVAATRVTHTDPMAVEGALAVALAARDGAAGRAPVGGEAAAAWARALPARVAMLAAAPASAIFDRSMQAVAEHLARGASPAELAAALGCARGVTGFIMHTVPAALFCWLRRPDDPRGVIGDVLALGGDADTTGAIAGGIAGATAGAAALPAEWVDGIVDWPRSVAWMRRLAARLAGRFPRDGDALPGAGALPLFWPALPLRNAFFALVVLLHGLRRLLPPY